MRWSCAPRRRWRRKTSAGEPACAPRSAVERVPYDGAVRVRAAAHTVGAGSFGRGEPPWAHDYPRAERNFTRILEEITLIKPHLDESNIFTMDDPELFAYPIAYMSEPGFWQMTDAELAGMQEYVKKGGFIIFDDFRGQHWYNFEEQVRRDHPERPAGPARQRAPDLSFVLRHQHGGDAGLLRPGVVPRRL